MRWNQGAASIAVKGGRFRTGAAAATAEASASGASGIVVEGQGARRRSAGLRGHQL